MTHEPQSSNPQPPSLSILIPAAGSGERLGLGPKAFLQLGQHTLLEWVVAAFLPHHAEVIVGVAETEQHRALPSGTVPVLGGPNRQATVYNMLQAATGDVVMIHDAARPFVPQRVILDLMAAMNHCSAATAALPSSDTLVHRHQHPEEPNHWWGHSLDRSQIWAVQTPQAFHRSLLLEAHHHANRDHHHATDDAGLVARLGHPVKLVHGDSRLLKLTRPDDWPLAQALASVWNFD
jgi:2-C-methyl-D-erythritol 4-phosphate cytidylyltransferase